MTTTSTHEEALQLMQASGYDTYDQDYYRALRILFGMTPYEAFCYIIQERGWEQDEDEEEAEQP